jgi:hypothetical protein
MSTVYFEQVHSLHCMSTFPPSSPLFQRVFWNYKLITLPSYIQTYMYTHTYIHMWVYLKGILILLTTQCPILSPYPLLLIPSTLPCCIYVHSYHLRCPHCHHCHHHHFNACPSPWTEIPNRKPVLHNFIFLLSSTRPGTQKYSIYVHIINKIL